MSILSKSRVFFDTLFKKHLFITNTSLGIAFIALGDLIQQNLEKKFFPGKAYDTNRTKNMTITGAGFGVGGHFWYRFLDRKFPGTSRGTVVKKLLCEAAAGPPFLLMFFLGLGALEKKPLKSSFEDFKKNFIMICIADWAVYLPLQAINFYYLPPRYRVLYVMTIMLAYDVFLSYVTHKEENRRLHQGKVSE